MIAENSRKSADKMFNAKKATLLIYFFCSKWNNEKNAMGHFILIGLIKAFVRELITPYVLSKNIPAEKVDKTLEHCITPIVSSDG